MAAYLTKKEGWTAEQAYTFIQKRRPVVTAKKAMNSTASDVITILVSSLLVMYDCTVLTHTCPAWESSEAMDQIRLQAAL